MKLLCSVLLGTVFGQYEDYGAYGYSQYSAYEYDQYGNKKNKNKNQYVAPSYAQAYDNGYGKQYGEDEVDKGRFNGLHCWSCDARISADIDVGTAATDNAFVSLIKCVDIGPHCNPAKCDNGFNKKFCLKTCGICERWTPEAVGDISYLEELGPDNCEDTNDECAFWAADNQCMVNPVYMLRHCPASCKQCTPRPCTNTFAGITPRVIFVKMDSPASTFAEAEEICAKNLGQLAFFKNEAEYNEYLREPITEKEWLGTTRFGDGWLNSDGSAPFLKWNTGEPNNSGGENCVEIYVTSQDQSSQLMNDQSCGDRNKFRCRIETYLDDDEKQKVCLNDPSADQCQASEIVESCIKAEDEFKVSLEIRCNGVDDAHRGVAALSRGSNDYYFGVGSVQGWPQNLFFWMENPNGLNAVGAEILTHDGTQWWQNSINPTFVFPCTPGEWNRVILTQHLDSHTNKWIKTLTINGEDRYRITSDAPNEGTLTAFDNIPGRAFSKNQMRNFKIEPYTLSFGAACDKSSGNTWTKWLNRDNPRLSGDWETLNSFIPEGKVCNNPRAIQAQARSDGSSEKVHFNLNTADVFSGFWCINGEQPYGQQCADFYVRFCCNENDWEPVCADPCFGKQNCVTIVDCNEIYPEKGKIAGTITNPSKHFRFSFDFKCSSENDPELHVRSANALMLNSIGANTALWDFGTTFFELITLQNNPMNIQFYGNLYKRSVVSDLNRRADFSCPTGWASYIFERKALDSTRTGTSMRTSDGTVIFSHTDLTTDLPDMPDTLYVMAGSKSYQPSRLYPLRNVAFENL